MFKLFVFFYIYRWLCVAGIEDFRNHKNWPTEMEEICGESNADRIVGGEYAKLGQFPWMVQLVYDDHGKLINKCGGSLITPTHVISAAHCVYGFLSKVLHAVVLGDHDIRTDPDCEDDICAEPKQTIKIANIQSHEAFDSNTNYNDITLLTLQRKAILNGWVVPICLPTKHEHLNGVAEVAGWGYSMALNHTSVENKLRFVKLPLLDMDSCRKYIDVIVDETIQICAGSSDRNQDSCNGDSGGPIMQVANSAYGPKYYIIGIVSYGLANCGDAPAIYTRVSNYMHFILNAMST